MAGYKVRVNGALRGTPRVKVIGSAGEPLGVMALAEALRRAIEEGLDLVEINPKAAPPVCKILDYGKYTYAEKKKVALATRESKEGHVPKPDG